MMNYSEKYYEVENEYC